jgi:hypothetical protein
MYSPLEAGEIRLLCLHPGVRDEALVGSLKIIQLRGTGGQPSREYDALSYVWGEAKSQHGGCMMLQGLSIEITQSLANALTRLRLPTTERFIWINFLCINQSDGREKSTQVRMMHEIFGYARRTCVHLGVTGPKTTFGFQALETLRSHPTTGWNSIWENPDLVRAGILDVMQRSWWTRTWCLQEAVVAKEVVLICGNHSLTWPTDAKEVYKFLRSLKATVLSPQWEMFKVDSACLNPLMEILELQLDTGPDKHTWNPADQTPDLLDIAYDMRYRVSADPRDKLFGVLALAQSRGYNTTDLENLVNYTNTYMECYEEFARITLPRDPFDPQSNVSGDTHASESRSELPLLPRTAQYVDDGFLSSPDLRDQELDRDAIVRRQDTRFDFPDKRRDCLGDVCKSDCSPEVPVSMSCSVEHIGNEIQQAMAAIRNGQFETAADVFICLGQSLRSNAHETHEPVKRMPSKVERRHTP